MKPIDLNSKIRMHKSGKTRSKFLIADLSAGQPYQVDTSYIHSPLSASLESLTMITMCIINIASTDSICLFYSIKISVKKERQVKSIPYSRTSFHLDQVLSLTLSNLFGHTDHSVIHSFSSHLIGQGPSLRLSSHIPYPRISPAMKCTGMFLHLS